MFSKGDSAYRNRGWGMFGKLIWCSLALWLASGVGQAAGISSLQFSSHIVQKASGEEPGAEVVLNGVKLVSFPAGRNAPARAQDLASRLTAAALSGAQASQVAVSGDGRAQTISIAGGELVTLDKSDAFAMSSTLEGLAQAWTGRIREAFALPYLSVPLDKLVVPLGEARQVPLIGNLRPPLRAGASPGLAGAAVDEQEMVVTVTGTATGSATLTINAGPAYLNLPLQVMKWAGRIGPGRGEVTGPLAPAWLLGRSARAAAALAVQSEPGAMLTWGEPQVPQRQLALGGECTVTVGVGISGPDYLGVSGQVPVAVHNVPVPAREAGLLMISNNPEQLRALGLWYEARLGPGAPARLLYHHLNASGQSADLVVELANTTAAPARVRIIEGTAGPSRDEIFVGHAATSAFLERQQAGLGYVAAIPPQTRYLVASHRLPVGQIASGVADLRLLEGEGVMVRVRLLPAITQPLYASLADYRPSQVGEQYVFPNPTKSLSASYTVGGNWAFVTIGRHAIAGQRDGETLRGNYGVFYDVDFRVHNPTDQAAQVELGLMAAGGACRGVLLIEGHKYESKLVGPRQEQVMASFGIPARSERTISVRTMPQSGSNYPVQLVLRRTGYQDGGMAARPQASPVK